MLSSDVLSTPRPRPPAKLRRSTSTSTSLRETASKSSRESLFSSENSRPDPPPYESPTPSTSSSFISSSFLLGSPLSATSQLIGIKTDATAAAYESDHDLRDRIKERSHEEIKELVHKAEYLIRERKSELDTTSAVCKTLLEKNFYFKSKNDSLIARIPSGSNPSSPVLSPERHATPSPSHSRSSSLYSPPAWSPKIPTPPRRHGHERRPSCSPSALAALADQNAELLAKLQDLETDSARADATAKKRLKALEREIQILKEELDKNREASERLEEKLQRPALENIPPGLDEELIRLWKKLDRETKVRKLRESAQVRKEENADSMVRDFVSGNLKGHPVPSPTVDVFSTSAIPSDFSISRGIETASQSFESLQGSASRIIDDREQRLVSKLLSKIRELEETNTQLIAQHYEARLNLQKAENDVENVKRLCDFISEEVNAGLEFEMVVDEQEKSLLPDDIKKVVDSMPKKTIRLRSVGRKASLNLETVRVSPPSRVRILSESGSQRVRKHVSQPDLSHLIHPDTKERPKAFRHIQRKARKSVRGLFDEDSEPLSTISASPVDRFPNLLEDQFNDESSVSPRITTVSPVLDPGNTSPLTPLNEFESHEVTRSLGSELSGELEEGNLRLDGRFTHSRSKSVAELLDEAEKGDERRSSFRSGLGRRIPRNKQPTSTMSLRRSARRVETDHTDVTSDNLPLPNEKTTGDSRSQNPFVRLLVELWLWLQFIIIIFVFLFSMAKAGPTGLHKQPHSSSKAQRSAKLH